MIDSSPGTATATVRQAERGPFTTIVDLVAEPRAIAALALGLADSRLDRRTSVEELARSAELDLLFRARDHLWTIDHHSPEVAARADSLLAAAVHQHVVG